MPTVSSGQLPDGCPTFKERRFTGVIAIVGWKGSFRQLSVNTWRQGGSLLILQTLCYSARDLKYGMATS